MHHTAADGGTGGVDIPPFAQIERYMAREEEGVAGLLVPQKATSCIGQPSTMLASR